MDASGGPWEAGPGDGGQGRVRKSRVDQETLSYLSEIVETAKGVEDDEERALMLGNALEEVESAKLTVLSDAECSHIIEDLISQGSVVVSVKLLSMIADGDTFFELSSSMFGSHVMEKLFVAVSSQLESATPDETAAVEETLGALIQYVSDYMMDFVMDRSASHVVRELLNTLAGREISPRHNKPPPGPLSSKKRKKKKAPTGLASKVVLDSSFDSGLPPEPLFPKLIDKLVADVTNASMDLVAQLSEDTYASPFLQVLVAATAHNSHQLCGLVSRLFGADTEALQLPEPLSAVPQERVVELMHHRIASHLVELCVKMLPAGSGLLAEVFRGRLYELCLHPNANFVVQSMIAATKDSEQLQIALDEIGPHVSDLLGRRRSGVVAALVAACARLSSCETAMCRALSRGLHCMQSSAAGGHTSDGQVSRESGLVELLVTLDTPLQLKGSFAADGAADARFSPAGCAMLAAILRYPLVSSQKFMESFNLLGEVDLVRLAGDAGGCRVVESFVASNTNPKVKAKFMKKMKGHWAAVVLRNCAPSITVERCFDAGRMADKEVIVSDIAAKETEILAKHYGPALLARLDVSGYKRDPESWRRHIGSAVNIKSEFMKMFDDGGAAAGEGHEGGSATTATAHRASGTPADAPSAPGIRKEKTADIGIPPAGQDGKTAAIEHLLMAGAGGKEKKKQKKEKKSLAEADRPSEETAPPDTSERKKKKRKAAAGSEDVEPQGEADSNRKQHVKEKRTGKKKIKKKKSSVEE